MKLILTGATGYIGSQVLRQAVSDPSISHVFTLTRKPLSGPCATHGKVTNIVHDDFSRYDEVVLEKLKGAEACIWMIGVAQPSTDPRPVDVGFTQAASRAFMAHLQPYIASPADGVIKPKPFRFIYLSGAASSSNQDSSLWFNAMGRRSRGEAETALLDLAQKEGKDKYQAFIARPGMVYRREWMCISPDMTIPLQWLAAALLGIAKGEIDDVDKTSGRFENRALAELGKRLIKDTK